MKNTVLYSVVLICNAMLLLHLSISVPAAEAKRLSLCELTPKWRLNRTTFPSGFGNAHVKLVALLKASCGFCRTQASRLGQLHERLRTELNYTDLAFVIVNSHEADSFGRSQIFKTSVPVLQDTGKVHVWKMYNASTDDMLVFDRCNRLVNHLALPDSIVDLNGGAVREAIISAYEKEPCGAASSCNRRYLSKPVAAKEQNYNQNHHRKP